MICKLTCSLKNKLLSSTVARLVHTVLQAAVTNCMALQDLPRTVGIHEIKKSNVAVEWIPILFCVWDVHNPQTNSYMFPVFFLKSYRQMRSFSCSPVCIPFPLLTGN